MLKVGDFVELNPDAVYDFTADMQRIARENPVVQITEIIGPVPGYERIKFEGYNHWHWRRSYCHFFPLEKGKKLTPKIDLVW